MRLSDREWKVLEVLWQGEGLALGPVVEALRPGTGWSRNTVFTYLTRMEGKGLVTIDKQRVPHLYRPAAGPAEPGIPRLRRADGGRLFEGGDPHGPGAG